MGIENNISEAVDLNVVGDFYSNGEKIEGVQTTTWGTHYLIEADTLQNLLDMRSKCSALEKSTSHIMDLVKSNKIAQGSGDSEELKKLRAEVASLRDALKTAEDRAEINKQNDAELLDARTTIESLQKKVYELEQSKGKAKNPSEKTSVKTRTKKGDKLVSLALSMSLRGMEVGEIVQELKKQKLQYTCSHIHRVLSVSKAEDKERLRGIISAYPAEFEGISDEDFDSWFADRYKRSKKVIEMKKKAKQVETEEVRESAEVAENSEGIPADVDEWGEPIVPPSEEAGKIETPVRGTFAPAPAPASGVSRVPRKKPRPRNYVEKLQDTMEETTEEAPIVAPEPEKRDIGLGEMPRNVEYSEKESFEERFARVRREK